MEGAVMANPLNAVVWLENKLHKFGVSMQAGDVIMSGSFVNAISFNAGDSIVALFDELGEVTFRLTA
jgi:2-keto-4-pentenoate hydratase